MNESLNEITPGLYLGDIFAARNPSLLNECQITHVLTVARSSLGLLSNTLDTAAHDGTSFRHLQIELDDLPDEKLYERLEEGVEFIDSALSSSGVVWKDNISVGQALEIVQGKRKKARPNAGFYRQLVEWEKRCKEKSSEET
ncbi:hypothetical protein Dda_8656 [Drechslerella dactyloides]|uniref:Tyrosine-protein phosphatase domain-containing protein n=1 Tax=Drechslerella dactyloides TaxID=74499 RepID=A0AAD6IQP7_DREDA|nr:hypothetical protein Dda_8656 [Drechslerella dactyloides]